MRSVCPLVPTWPKRFWINAPSTFDECHRLHGTNVLGVHEYADTWRIYFLSGKTISRQIFLKYLVEGWKNE